MLNVFRNLDWTVLLDLALSVIPVLVCITIHEVSHGLCALALGDDTAKREGRLSLNPFKHFDLVGFIMLVVVHFGWAKPVPVDMRRFKNPKLGMALTALAGPASNMILAAVALFLYGLLFGTLYSSTVGFYALYSLSITARISVSLGIFNLIPVPPLDGSKVLFSVMPQRWYYVLMRYEKYGSIVMIVLVLTGILSDPLSAAVKWVLGGFGVFWKLGAALAGLLGL
ncbi:MAG: site-2 protease family protein [Oscillospiraceae bacterium]|nr:site-2 protease family protein [Oscillospiraceae bacterium]